MRRQTQHLTMLSFFTNTSLTLEAVLNVEQLYLRTLNINQSAGAGPAGTTSCMGAGEKERPPRRGRAAARDEPPLEEEPLDQAGCCCGCGHLPLGISAERRESPAAESALRSTRGGDAEGLPRGPLPEAQPVSQEPELEAQNAHVIDTSAGNSGKHRHPPRPWVLCFCLVRPCSAPMFCSAWL